MQRHHTDTRPVSPGTQKLDALLRGEGGVQDYSVQVKQKHRVIGTCAKLLGTYYT